MKTPFTDVFVNAFSSIKAWRTATFVLSAVLAYGTFQYTYLATHQSIVLVPQGLALNKTKVKVDLGEPYSPDYISRVAEQDAHFLLDWTPENVEQQYGLFVGRLTPSIHDQQNESLMAEAAQHKQEGMTQSFYRSRTGVKGSTVTLSGTLVRAIGGREVFRGAATYMFDYSSDGTNGVQVSGVTQPKDRSTDAPAATQK